MQIELTNLYNKKRELHNNLIATDYKALKYAEGVISEEEYASVKLLRQSWRNEINKIEKEIENLKNKSGFSNL